MKRNVFVGLVLAAAFTGCSKSIEETSFELIKQEMKAKAGYQPVSFKMDSLMASPEIFTATQGLVDSLVKEKSYKLDVEYAEQEKKLYSPLDKKEWNEAKTKLEQCQVKLLALNKSIRNNSMKIRKLKKDAPEFRGYVVLHKYQALSDSNKVVDKERIFLIDKEGKQITHRVNELATENILGLIKQGDLLKDLKQLIEE